jgi:predicted CXXCH cytochrome family protein
VSRSCSLCHSANASLFDGSKHRQAFAEHNWPECGQCHDNHAIIRPHDEMLGTATDSWCADCHREYAQTNRECNATADYLYVTITGMAGGLTRFAKASEELAAKGIDIESIDNQLTELSDGLKKARSYIHSFDRNTFEQVAAPGKSP